MPRRRQSVAPQTEFEVLSGRIHNLQRAVSAINQAQMTSVQVVDIVNFNDALEGMVCVDWPTKRFCWYHDEEWICVPPNATHAIKIFGDKKSTQVGDGAFKFPIERDLDNTVLVDAAAFHGEPATDPTVVRFTNKTRTITLCTVTIPAGSYDSYDTLPTIDTGGPATNPNNRFLMRDRIWIDVVSGGAGGRGLGAYMTFMPFRDPLADNP